MIHCEETRVPPGQIGLDLIFAAGPDDSFEPYHLYRDFTSLPPAIP